MLRRIVTWIILIAVVIGAAAGAYYYFVLRSQATAPTATQAATTTTTRASRGDLVISASGSGTVVPGAEVSIGFGSSGTLKEVLVKIGDRVEAGQPLARLDDTSAANQVAQAEINLKLAELSLDDLNQGVELGAQAAAEASLASARASLAKLTAGPDSQSLLAARETLKSAQNQLNKLLAGPDATELKNAEYALETAKNNLWSQQVSRDSACGGSDAVRCKQAEASVGNADAAVRKAQEELDVVKAGPTADTIADARAKVASAQAQVSSLLEKPNADEVAAAQGQVTKAQGDLDALLAGATTTELEKARLAVSQAEMNLVSAQRSMTETTLIAPIAGMVTVLTGHPGEAAGSGAMVTLSDLDHPQLQFWVEETDLASVVVGNSVNIVFEALPDLTFPGKIVSVDPVLVTQNGTPAVQALASIDLSAHPVSLLSGMNAEVEVVAGEARNALLVPVEALRELATDSYAVFVVQDDGELALRPVQVGLRDLVNAQILSGLQEGETVSVRTSRSSTSASATPSASQRQQQGAGGPMPFFEGGGPPR